MTGLESTGGAVCIVVWVGFGRMSAFETSGPEIGEAHVIKGLQGFFLRIGYPAHFATGKLWS